MIKITRLFILFVEISESGLENGVEVDHNPDKLLQGVFKQHAGAETLGNTVRVDNLTRKIKELGTLIYL